ncbi:nucleotidyltransferase domain-containing protein, partial [Acidithiobacillus ferrooxidans]|uniref:nucleotidyltransferase domain-containing protein n=1 Tax=Acidithiobacillus ferrooxidans TaxID=920 RepID=UPI002147B624|nr:nucleotidyltransferase domain-containing protein [Acidithiobacillus ferrooxidans]
MVDRKILSCINEMVSQEYPYSRGILLSGSLAAGTFSVKSDIDLIVITDRDELIDSSIRYKRYNFDIVGGSINTLVKLIHDDCTIRRGVYAHMVGHSKGSSSFQVGSLRSSLPR